MAVDLIENEGRAVELPLFAERAPGGKFGLRAPSAPLGAAAVPTLRASFRRPLSLASAAPSHAPAPLGHGALETSVCRRRRRRR